MISRSSFYRHKATYALPLETSGNPSSSTIPNSPFAPGPEVDAGNAAEPLLHDQDNDIVMDISDAGLEFEEEIGSLPAAWLVSEDGGDRVSVESESFSDDEASASDPEGTDNEGLDGEWGDSDLDGMAVEAQPGDLVWGASMDPPETGRRMNEDLPYVFHGADEVSPGAQSDLEGVAHASDEGATKPGHVRNLSTSTFPRPGQY